MTLTLTLALALALTLTLALTLALNPTPYWRLNPVLHAPLHVYAPALAGTHTYYAYEDALDFVI